MHALNVNFIAFVCKALETCGAHVCYYGGTCVNDTCQCPSNTFGVYCEYVKGEYTCYSISKDAGICTTCLISPFTIILYDTCEWVVYTPPILVHLYLSVCHSCLLCGSSLSMLEGASFPKTTSMWTVTGQTLLTNWAPLSFCTFAETTSPCMCTDRECS